MAKRKKAKRSEPFAMVPHLILDSEEYKRLPRCARDLLLQLIRQHNGTNNGAIYGAQAAIMSWCNFNSPTTAIKALRALIECGLVVVTFPGAERRSRRLGLRWLTPGTNFPTEVQDRTWEIWRPGLCFVWSPKPVKRRRRSTGRPEKQTK